MVNIPYRSSEALAVAHIRERLGALRRAAGAVILALLAAVLLALLLQRAPEGLGGKALHDLVPLDPSVISNFTA
jgi:hypothetical protein